MAGRRTTGPYDQTMPPAGASPYGFQGGTAAPQQQQQQQPAHRRPSAAEQQELQWMQEQQQAEAYQRQLRGQQPTQADPYAAYPHEAPTPQQAPLSGESPTARLTGEDEYFDPYAPSAAKAHRRTSSGGGEFMYPPVYRVSAGCGTGGFCPAAGCREP